MGRKAIDETNKRHGKLVVIAKDEEKSTPRRTYWICKCDCGNITSVLGTSLRNGHSAGCGCERGKNGNGNSGRKVKNIIGMRFGKLTVIEETPQRLNGSVVWKCLCDCGNVTEVPTGSLQSGGTQSCGCLKSIGEMNIIKILNENNIQYSKEFNVNIHGANRRFDFALLKNNQIIRLIEFDGPQHQKDYNCGYYSKIDYKILHNRDLEKDNYAYMNNIPLVRIPYSERDSITLDLILGDKYLL